jgi:ATPase subunit of ABC transporter with duplicated ATPase domains
MEKNTLVPQQSLLKESIQENYDDVLTPEEKEYAIREAAEKKLARKREQEYWEKVNNPPKPKMISAEELYRIVLGKALVEFGRNHKGENIFNLSEEEDFIYRSLALYFTRNPDFEKQGEDFSLKKGLMIFGNIGCGKTTAMRLFASNPHQSYSIISCRKVQSDFASKGFSQIGWYSDWFASTVPGSTYGQKQLGALFDDLGTESTAKNYGNELNVMADVIQNRYENESSTYFRTHFTTNLNTELIQEFYGSRVRSRLREMVNMIVFPTDSKDKRK